MRLRRIRRALSAGSPRCPTGCAATAVTTPDARQSRRSRTTSALERLGVPPEGGRLYDIALTHRSHAFESGHTPEHNERLEFLGDAVLEAVVTELIYRDHPQLSEGDMARLRSSVVNTTSLAETARGLGLGELVRLGKGEELSGGRSKESILANTFEAVIGAVFVERGFEVVRETLTPLFRSRIEASLETGRRYDAKTALQEVVVRLTGGSPRYRVSASGPDHDKRFTAQVLIDEELKGRGEGRSKKQAEYNAASEALASLEDEAETRGAAQEGGGAERDEGARDARAS